MSEVSEAAKKMVRHYVGVENPQISVFGDVWHIEGDRDNAEELAQHILDLQHKYDALAAENAALKEFFSVGISAAFEGCDWYGDDIQGKALELGLIREEKYDHETHAESVFNPEDFQQGDAVFTINDTPATDAHLNSVRADGVDMAVSELKDLAQRSESEAPIAAEHNHGAALYLMLFANQLRAGEPS